MILLTEPKRGRELVQTAKNLTETYPLLSHITTVGADVFLIIYPVFLIVLYLYGILKKQLQAKIGALFIFFGCFSSLLLNLFIQIFFEKQRPIAQMLQENFTETPLHQFLPTSSFPSDHSVVGMSVAVMTLLRGIKTKNKKLTIFAVFLVICAIMMGMCRVFTAVHRPSDILGGFLVGIIVPCVLIQPFFFFRCEKWILKPIVRFQEWLFEKLTIKY
ncbi:undecaprenyl-diphosphatase BcrC [candidate division SR1 bacterium]|nr:undecaprenyl-diphosphatase BcrC [candidate division SR1 bacterium]